LLKIGLDVDLELYPELKKWVAYLFVNGPDCLIESAEEEGLSEIETVILRGIIEAKYESENPHKEKPRPLCACGCGRQVPLINIGRPPKFFDKACKQKDYRRKLNKRRYGRSI
jgi:hypothetical protein